MNYFLIKLFVSCVVLGVVISCIALLNLIKISRKHKKLTPEEYLSKENRLVRNKYLVIGMVGITISSLAQVIIVFTR